MVNKQYKNRKITERIDKLLNDTRKGWNKTLEEEYNKIHEESIQIRKSVEKKVKKIGNGSTDWTPKLKKANNRIKYWKLEKQSAEGKKVGMKKRYRLMKQLKIKIIEGKKEEK